MHIVFMGVSGSGKSTVALSVAQRLGLPYAEADGFHPEANIAKMSAGTPLTDEDRRPWLRSLAAWISDHELRGESTLMACSALKRSYRDTLRSGAPGVYFVHLDAPTAVIAERLRARAGHFMPAGLLDSQQATLEPLEDDEAGITIDVSDSAAQVAGRVLDAVTAALGLSAPPQA
ncbi:gluconokinase [Nocardiopsis sediminis]|uniref:Gluconokinase n=1 Tax=Nocardiopsis sediminis TaxID=1778267 RepID=A0ABV8FS89_9ACTN